MKKEVVLKSRHKNFADVGNPLTTSVSPGLSKDSVYILLNTKIRAKNNITYSTNTIQIGT